MKITKIETEFNKKKVCIIYTVTKTPNFLERLFGFKEKQEKYKWEGNFYHHFPDTRLYINQEGEVLGFFHEITKALENWRRKF